MQCIQRCDLIFIDHVKQAGPGRIVKQEQEEISPNHVQRINIISVVWTKGSRGGQKLQKNLADVICLSSPSAGRWGKEGLLEPGLLLDAPQHSVLFRDGQKDLI